MSTDPLGGLSTRAVRGGLSPDPLTGAILPPIHQNTTYALERIGESRGHNYSRCSNPTVSALEAALGTLEGTPPAVCYATGLAAVTSLFTTLLSAGDHAVISDVVYGGTIRLVRDVLSRFGVEATFVDSSDTQNIARAIRPSTRLVFIETPANPTLKLTDVAGVAAIARAASVPLAVDNTFLTCVLQDCFAFGADITLYSTTKYIEGHNATVGGAVLTRDEALLDALRFNRSTLGSIQSPWDASLTLRGLKTLPLRIHKQSESALLVAEWLSASDEVERVYYPTHSGNPRRAIALRQQRAGGGMVSFEVRGGVSRAVAFMNALTLCLRAESLGATETLVTHPATMTHASVPAEVRHASGISDGLIRLSVGLESVFDIISDIERALDITKGGGHDDRAEVREFCASC